MGWVVDPFGHEQREALNERAQRFLDSPPDLVFTATGPVHVLRDLGYLPFTFGVPEQPPAGGVVASPVIPVSRLAACG